MSNRNFKLISCGQQHIVTCQVTVDAFCIDKSVSVTGREDPLGCERSRLAHLEDKRLTDAGEVVSLTRLPPFTPQEDSWYSFLLEAESTPGP
jgi:hypothetical protein